IEDRIIDKITIFGLQKSVTFLRYKKAIIIVIETIGNNVKNKACQSKCTSSHPDKVGPMSGPNAITIPIIPNAVPRRSTEIIASKTVINSSSIIHDPET